MYTAPEFRSPLRGRVRVQGDKSVSHRALILGALGRGPTRVEGLLEAEDVLHTAQILRDLGVAVERRGRIWTVEGRGLRGLSEPANVLDVGNSGTGIRLLAGVLAGQPFTSFITGDASVVRRPMRRIVEPLTRMGARIVSKSGGRAPLAVTGGRLRGITYRLPVASAQVKSCLLLAGLFARGRTTVVEPVPTRDHTERMMRHFGLDLERRGDRIVLTPPREDFAGRDLRVPADISSAAFFLVAALLVPGSRVVLKDVGVNPLRAGILEVLAAAGARIAVSGRREWNGEPVADVTVEHTPELRAFTVEGAMVANVIDEIPVLAVAAAAAKGRTVFRDAEELRHKESDRIRAVVGNLRALGAVCEELPDGFVVEGGRRLRGGVVQSHDDHRIVMAFTVAAALAAGRVRIDRTESVATSFPEFFRLLEGLRRG